jgi:heat shock protein HtpX
VSEPLNLFEQQHANRRRTRWLVFGFLVFFAWLGFGGDLVRQEWLRSQDPVHYANRGPMFPFFTAAMVLVGIVVVWRAWRGGANKVLWAAGARELVDPNSPQEKQLLNVVEEMAIASGITPPRVYIVNDADPNAFATGCDEQSACIAVTWGLLAICSRDELQAVIAHEIGHIRNLDMRLMTLLAALIGAVVLIRDGVSRMIFSSGASSSGSSSSGSSSRGSSDREGKGAGQLFIILLVIWIVSWILAPIVLRLLALGVSRNREYLADAMSVQFTRNPTALTSALQKIEEAATPTTSVKGSTAHLCIADPLGRPVNGRRGLWADLFGTHPPMEERIARLQEMSYGTAPTAGPAPAVG